jgi:hypothetical protein
MDQLITLLTNLLNLTKVAAVTVPGLLLTSAFAVLLWPPPPIDVVPVAVIGPEFPFGIASVFRSRTLNLSDVEFPCAVELTTLTEGARGDSMMDMARQNLIRDHSLSSPESRKPLSSQLEKGLSPELKSSVRDQVLLELEQIRLAECQDAEAELKQVQNTQSDFLSSDLAALEKQRENKKGAELVSMSSQIEEKRKALSGSRQAVAEIDRQQATLTRYSGMITSRLADPGRLRPKLDFNSFVTLQTNHIVGFIILSIAIGVVITPFRDALFVLLSRKLLRWL